MRHRLSELQPLLVLTLFTAASDARFSYSYGTGPGGTFFYSATHGGHDTRNSDEGGENQDRGTASRSAEIDDILSSNYQSAQQILANHQYPGYETSADESALPLSYATHSSEDENVLDSFVSGQLSDPSSAPFESEPEITYQGEPEADDPPCTHARQSPININTCRTKPRIASRLFLKNFDATPSSFNLSNTGKDVMAWMTWEGQSPPTVSGAGLPGTFSPFAIDMHWGVNDSIGSEHTVNGGRYPLELHIQCSNVKYDNLQEALANVDGIAVVGVFFSLDAKHGGRGFTALAEAISQVVPFDTTVQVAAPPPMASLLPESVADRAQYKGSLTGAPYLEVVHWVMLLTPARILAPELQLLRALLKEDDVPIGNTFREPQARCGRKVVRSGLRQLFERCVYNRVTDPITRLT